jgi:dTDP-4-dehydrorhamnose reductase
LITGGTGTLGQAVAAACRHRAIAHVLTTRADLDLANQSSIASALDRHGPWAVINAAGWVRVDDAECDEVACHAANTHGALRLASACASRDIPTIDFSSDLVFDGAQDQPYREGDPPGPLNAYGRSKVAAEQAIAGLVGKHLIVRTAAFFSSTDRHNFAIHAIETLRRGEAFHAACDQVVSPTHVPDLADAVLDLAIDGETGIWHLSHGEAMSWADFGKTLARACGLDPELIIPVPGRELGWRARRPTFVPLASDRGGLLPPLSHAVERFAREVQSMIAKESRMAA